MLRNERPSHSPRSSCTSGRNWVANFLMMVVVMSPSFDNSNDGGLVRRSKRSAASTTRPSQWPAMRAWFTMRAHAAASAVATHGLAIPSTHTCAPNMSNNSRSPKAAGVAEAGKLGNEKPSGVGRNVVATDSTNTGAPPPELLPPQEVNDKITAIPKIRNLAIRSFCIT